MIDTHPEQQTPPQVAGEQPAGGEGAANRRTSRIYGVALVCILLIAAGIRLGGINFGLPYLYHWDEKGYFHGAFYVLATAGRTELLVAGNIPYLLLPVLWVMSAVKGGTSALITAYLQDPTPFYLLGRGMWVGFQLLAVWLTYLVGRDALSRRAGLIAAAFLAVAFLAASEGHYVKGDTTAMLCAIFAAWAALRLVERPTIGRYVLVGAAGGVALACKAYTYTLFFVPLLAHVAAWSDWQARWRNGWKLLPAVVAYGGAFAVALPAVLVDPGGTWDIWKVESQISLASLAAGGLPTWLTYWTVDLRDGIGLPIELCGLAGFGLWLVLWFRWRDTRRLLLLVFPVLLLVGMVSWANHFARYALPLVPFVALAGGDLIDHGAQWIADRLHPPGWLLAAATVVAVALISVPSLVNDVRFDAYTSGPDTRTQAVRWIETHLPAGATIVGEGSQGFEAMSTLGVPVRPDPSDVGVTWSPTSLRPPDEFWRVPLLNWLRNYTPTYKLTFAPTLTRRGEITSTAQWGDPAAFIMISWRSDPEKRAPTSPFWDDLARNYEQAAKFKCAPCFPDDPYAWAIDYPSLARVDPLSRSTTAGPVVWVYTKKKP